MGEVLEKGVSSHVKRQACCDVSTGSGLTQGVSSCIKRQACCDVSMGSGLETPGARCLSFWPISELRQLETLSQNKMEQ